VHRRSAVFAVSLSVLVAAVSLPTVPVAASGRSAERMPPVARPGLADLDRDGIGDGLGDRLARMPEGRRVQVLVTHDETFEPSDARAVVGAAGLGRRLRLIDGFSARLTPSQIRGLAAMPGVLRVEEDPVVHATMDGARVDAGADAARATYGVSGAGVELCVLDTGADPAHEQLDSRIVAFEDFIGTSTVAYDDNGHGTHVAAIAAGDGVGGAKAAGFRGVAPGASLAIGKVLNDKGTGTGSGIIAGIQWCVDRGSDLISMSLATSVGSDGLDAMSAAVDAAAAQGVLVVVAAGNSGDLPGTVGSPGAAARAITVGATAEFSSPLGAVNRSEGVFLAPFSSRGPTLDGRTKPDVVAPGVTITSARGGTSSGYVTYSGTSMATPFVAGSVALALESGVPPASIKPWIRRTAHDRGAPGPDDEWGAGLLDALALVAWGAGTADVHPMPTHLTIEGVVGAGETWTSTFEVGADATDVPIAATIVLDGSCTLPTPAGCLDLEWTPDLDARLLGPGGGQLAESTCVAGADCGAGRQETLTAMPTGPGTYTIEVYPWSTQGGAFRLDLSSGPLVAPAPAPVAWVADLDAVVRRVSATSWRAAVTIEVHDGADLPVADARVRGRMGAGVTRSCTTNEQGRCSVRRLVPIDQRRVRFLVMRLRLEGATYLATGNRDPDGDSNGTRIIVRRP